LTDQLELHLLELPKLESALDRNDEPMVTAWGRFLVAAADEDLEVLAMENPVFKQAKDALERLSADPEARLRAEQREMWLISERLDRAKVLREGRVEGRIEGQALLLEQLLTTKFGELPGEARRRLEGATEAQLLAWSKRLLVATTLDDVFA
jgi:predicted transposase/invertase (TIGR01784 family)